jgi:hypothetical protein
VRDHPEQVLAQPAEELGLPPPERRDPLGGEPGVLERGLDRDQLAPRIAAGLEQIAEHEVGLRVLGVVLDRGLELFRNQDHGSSRVKGCGIRAARYCSLLILSRQGARR